jgi:hypothetical protein
MNPPEIEEYSENKAKEASVGVVCFLWRVRFRKDGITVRASTFRVTSSVISYQKARLVKHTE